jgi:hypothetical protein
MVGAEAGNDLGFAELPRAMPSVAHDDINISSVFRIPSLGQ